LIGLVVLAAFAQAFTLPVHAQSRATYADGGSLPNPAFDRAQQAYRAARREIDEVIKRGPYRRTAIRGARPEVNEEVAQSVLPVIQAYERTGVLGQCRAVVATIEASNTAKKSGWENDCQALERNLAGLRQTLADARQYIADYKSEQKQKASEQAAFEREQDKLKKQYTANADFLAKEEAAVKKLAAGRKARSLDDFLADRGPRKAKGKAGGDFLAASGSGGDFLSGASSPSGDDKGDFLSNASTAAGSFKIERRGNLQGVVDGSGKTLIPFRDWAVLQYQVGIAEVRIVKSSMVCSTAKDTSNGYDTAVEHHLVGFVDSSGAFLEPPTSRVFEPSVTPQLFLTSTPTDLSPAEYRALERRKKLREQRTRLANQQCKREKLAFKRRVLSGT
jgi:hypothetical protein